MVVVKISTILQKKLWSVWKKLDSPKVIWVLLKFLNLKWNTKLKFANIFKSTKSVLLKVTVSLPMGQMNWESQKTLYQKILVLVLLVPCFQITRLLLASIGKRKVNANLAKAVLFTIAKRNVVDLWILCLKFLLIL